LEREEADKTADVAAAGTCAPKDTPPRAAVVVLVVVVVVVVVNLTAAGILAVVIVVAVVFVPDVVAGAGVVEVVVVVVVGVVDVVLVVTLLDVAVLTVVVAVVTTFVTAGAAVAFPFDPNSAAPTFVTAATALAFPFDEGFVDPNSAAPFIIPDFAIDAILAMEVVVAGVVVVAVVVVVVVMVVEMVDVLVVVVVVVVVVVAVDLEAKKERAVNEVGVGTFAGSVTLLAPRAKPSLIVFVGTKAGPCLSGKRAVFDALSCVGWWLTGVGWRRLASAGEPSGGPVMADLVGVECSLMMPRIVGLAGRSRPIAATGSTLSVVKVRVPALLETFFFLPRRRPFFLASFPSFPRSESLSS
jgi:hypothetical protein